MNQSEAVAAKIPIVAIVGPTASGKTALSIEAALRMNGEIVSADSMQVYRRMDIATAKPTPEERRGVPHHLIDILEPAEPFSVADYTTLAHEAVRRIHEAGRLPFLVGGTGLYVDSLLNDIRFAEEKSDPSLRQELAGYAADHGPEALWMMLRELDPEYAAGLHPNNLGRVIRAIEVCRTTGVTMSEQQRRSRERPSRYLPLKIGLDYKDRQILYDRINQRVDQMLAEGLLQEAKALLGTARATAMQAIGYKELSGYLEGRCSLKEAVEALKQETRRYAKRQLTWFRRDKTIAWYYPDTCSYEELQKNILLSIENFIGMWYDKNTSISLQEAGRSHSI